MSDVQRVRFVYKAVYDALLLDRDGCPVGGAIELDYIFDFSQVQDLPAAEDRLEPSGTMRAEFGPRCDEVAVYGG